MSFPFVDIAKAFHFIDSSGQQRIYMLRERPDLEARVRSGEISRKLFRELGPYSISLYHTDIKELNHALEQPNADDDSIRLLLPHHYDEQLGVSLSFEGGKAIIP